MKKSRLTFVCTQLGVTDYLSWHNENTFNDLIVNLKQKYENQVLKYLRKNFQNIRENITLNEITIKLHYFDKEGNILSIGNFVPVIEIVSKGINKIYWDPEPIGGIKYLT
ncbi:MAG: hypothetical protein ACTSWG_09580 [Candidatus Helarchaeota archaeon]